MNNSIKIAVFGGGSWATAIVKMLSENLEEVGWYMRSSYAIEYIKRNKHNPNYISSIEFNPNQLFLSDDINEVVKYADYLIFAIPSAFLKDELDKITESLEGKVIFSAIKGIVPES
ncbi:MAG: glycerol-3-phosphate dehydrogenase, partial [Flavobacteriaceae bacterium]|nr:glycerol-3-phosphate dehydrogenase [Flavobacteriaceae bacterium]